MEETTGIMTYRAPRCTRTSPLPLLPSGPGGVGGVASRGARPDHFNIFIRGTRESVRQHSLQAVLSAASPGWARRVPGEPCTATPTRALFEGSTVLPSPGGI